MSNHHSSTTQRGRSHDKGIADLTVPLQNVQQIQLLQHYRTSHLYCHLEKKKKCSIISGEEMMNVRKAHQYIVPDLGRITNRHVPQDYAQSGFALPVSCFSGL
jgi:hypothetical protein